MGDQDDRRHDPAELEQRTAHVIIRGHQTQGGEPFLRHPFRRLPSVPGGIAGAIAEHHATFELLGRLAGNAQEFGHVDTLVDAGDEQFLGAFLGQQGKADAKPPTAAGQHHHGVGHGLGIVDGARHGLGEPHEAGRPDTAADDSETLDFTARWRVLHNVLPIPLGAVEEYCQLCRMLPQLRPQTIEGAVALLGCAAVRVRLEDAYKAGDRSIPDLLFYSDWTTKRILLASHDALQRLTGGAS